MLRVTRTKENDMSDLTVAKTILEQLGGNKFRVMTGAKNLVGTDNSLSFRLPGSGFCKQGINSVKITLNGSDLYDVRYMRVRGSKITTVEESTTSISTACRTVSRG